LISRRGAVLGGLFLVLLTAIVTWGLATGAYGGGPGMRGLVRSLLRGTGFANLAVGLALVETRSAQVVHPDQLAQAALRGAVASLGDPYSQYLTPGAYRALLGNAAGRYTGIGIELQQDAEGDPVVDRVVAGSPADLAAYAGQPAGSAPGLRAGDRILRVDGQDAAGMDPGLLRSLIVGPAGSQVRLQVLRPAPAGPGQTLAFTLTRRAIELQAVTWAVLPGGIGYLAIAMFTQQSGPQMQAAVAALQARHVGAIVVDLRDDPGGLITAAQQVARYLLPGGVLAYLQPRGGARQAVAVTAPLPLGVPYAVLIDGHTASAAELVAGAIQDDGAAPLLGAPTFGKGSVQQVFPLAGGAALKLTVAHYLTPRGRVVDGVGITPDRAVPFPGQSADAMGQVATDPQLAAAVALLQARGA